MKLPCARIVRYGSGANILQVCLVLSSSSLAFSITCGLVSTTCIASLLLKSSVKDLGMVDQMVRKSVFSFSSSFIFVLSFSSRWFMAW